MARAMGHPWCASGLRDVRGSEGSDRAMGGLDIDPGRLASWLSAIRRTRRSGSRAGTVRLSAVASQYAADVLAYATNSGRVVEGRNGSRIRCGAATCQPISATLVLCCWDRLKCCCRMKTRAKLSLQEYSQKVVAAELTWISRHTGGSAPLWRRVLLRWTWLMRDFVYKPSVGAAEGLSLAQLARSRMISAAHRPNVPRTNHRIS
jgi:hypothetical protein